MDSDMKALLYCLGTAGAALVSAPIADYAIRKDNVDEQISYEIAKNLVKARTHYNNLELRISSAKSMSELPPNINAWRKYARIGIAANEAEFMSLHD